MEPKILVFSNNCFSKSNSNGRTLGNFFLSYPKQNLAQFFIENSNPDFEICGNFFRVTDRDVVNSLFFKKVGSKVEFSKDDNKNKKKSKNKIKRNSLTMLIRDLIWKIGLWKNDGFYNWIKEFNPDIILLQAGDSPFMYCLAYEISEKFKKKLVIYNSEGYYFKKFDYFKSTGISHYIYPLFYKILKKDLEKAYSRASYIFYSCDELKKEYDNIFDKPSDVIYTISEFSSELNNKKRVKDNFKISYCGNLGLNRHKNLIEIAEVVQEINSQMFIDIYGIIPNKEVENDFKECKGIKYHGFISYENVKKIMNESDLLLHTESFDEFYKEDLKFAFSTKIADSLSSGTSFLLYAPENLACTKYLIKNDLAHVVSEEKNLYNILFKIINNQKYREKCLKNALNASKKNHNLEENSKKFISILENLKN